MHVPGWEPVAPGSPGVITSHQRLINGVLCCAELVVTKEAFLVRVDGKEEARLYKSTMSQGRTRYVRILRKLERAKPPRPKRTPRTKQLTLGV